MVSEELNSVETNTDDSEDSPANWFQKDLIVWKPVSFDDDGLDIVLMFQKNLIVWKHIGLGGIIYL